MQETGETASNKELMKKALEQLPCPPTVECGNQLDLSGGAIYVNKSNPVISRSKIINNVAGFGYPLKIVVSVGIDTTTVITNHPLKKGRKQ